MTTRECSYCHRHRDASTGVVLTESMNGDVVSDDYFYDNECLVSFVKRDMLSCLDMLSCQDGYQL